MLGLTGRERDGLLAGECRNQNSSEVAVPFCAVHNIAKLTWLLTLKYILVFINEVKVFGIESPRLLRAQYYGTKILDRIPQAIAEPAECNSG